MEILEIYADEAGETHFRRTSIAMESRNYAPPSAPVRVSAEDAVTTSLFLAAPPGWDTEFHPTPRRQYAILLSGRVTATVTDGETIEAGPGTVVLLNDADSKGHLTKVQGGEDAHFLLVGLQEG